MLIGLLLFVGCNTKSNEPKQASEVKCMFTLHDGYRPTVQDVIDWREKAKLADHYRKWANTFRRELKEAEKEIRQLKGLPEPEYKSLRIEKVEPSWFPSEVK